MATVHFSHVPAATNAALLSVWMPALHTQLLAAGWTLEYADSAAIGGGSEGTPAWDATPTINTNAGIAVYRMPANGTFTRWYVRLRPGWDSNTGRAIMRGVTVGPDHDGSGSVSGSELTPSVLTFTTTGLETAIAASEDGFFLILNGGTNRVIASVERVRLPTDVVQDAVHVSVRYGTTASRIITTAGTVDAPYDFYVFPIDPWSATGVAGQSMSVEYLDGPICVGPYRPHGTPFLDLPRLARIVYTGSDFGTGGTAEMDVDGGLKTYQVLNSAVSTSFGAFAVATE